MPRDYRPFEPITYPAPTITSIEEAVWIWFMWTVEPIPPGEIFGGDIYTIPSGRKAIVNDILLTTEFRGEVKFFFPGGDNILYALVDSYVPVSHGFVLPPVGLAGETFRFEGINNDIVSGHFRFTATMWLIPGSEPEKPKKDTPEERFRVGDFNAINHILLPNGETLYLFNKRGENKINYLRFKDYGKKTQRVLASLHLKLEDSEKIMSALREKPEKVVKLLKEIEKGK